MPVNACTVRPQTPPSASDRRTAAEITSRVGDLVKNRFGNDVQRAFNNYAPNGQADSNAVNRLLADAHFGDDAFMPGPYRGMVAGALVSHFDTNCDNKVSFQEFQAGLNNAGR